VSSGATAGGYEAFFGLKESPFSLSPNPRFLFESATHRAALEQVTYALRRREPLVVVTGEIGTGKTMLCRTMLSRLERLTFLSVISDPLLGRDDLLKQILEDFGVISRGRTKQLQPGRHELVQALQEFLASLIPLQAHAVVMIDEAQHLAPAVLEEIRLLSNIEGDQGTQLQIVLVGQTDLETALKRPDMRQFEQRVTRRCRLEPLDASEVRKYIEHRLAVAELGIASQEGRVGQEGVPRPIFTTDAMESVARLSGGLPRVINIVCDRALEAAFTFRRQTVDQGAVDSAARALGLSVPAPPAVPASPAVAALSAVEGPAVPAPPAVAALSAVEGSTDFDRLFDEAAASAPHHSVRLPRTTPAAAPPAVLSLPNLAELPDPPGPPGLPDLPYMADVADIPDATFEPAVETPKSTRLYALAAILVAVLAIAVWFATRGADVPAGAPAAPTAKPTPAAPTAAAPTEKPPAPAPAETTPPAAPQPDAVAPATGAAPPSTTETTPVAPPAAPPAPGERFEIVVASFRTDSRAAVVAQEVAALGMAYRTRTVADGWHQVLAGPYSTRAEAEAAQQRLAAAGLGGTQIAVR
jgi:type II secretory pathway predicted ATPase ExeA/cell division septation protein DedD